jgi:WD40 repeat protein
VRVYDAKSFVLAKTLTGHSRFVFALAWAADGKKVASASLDKTARLWDLASGTASVLTDETQGALHVVAFSPDGRQVATAGEDEHVRVWDASTRKMVQDEKDIPGLALAISFSRDAKTVYCALDDKSVRAIKLQP